MTMTEKYKILCRYIKDMSSETPDVETYLYVKDFISQYKLNININSKAIKNKMIEINTALRFEDKNNSKKKSIFEIVYATIIKISDEVKEKKELEKIILSDVQVEIYPNLESSFINLLKESSYPNIKFEKKIDFVELYKKRLIKKIFLKYF